MANPNPSVHLKAADCCPELGLDAPKREMLHLMSHRDELWPMSRVNTPPSLCVPWAQPGCASWGGVLLPGGSGSTLHLGYLCTHPNPKPSGPGVRSSGPSCISRLRCFIHGRGMMDPTFWLCMLEWDGGDRQPWPSWIHGCSRCCAAHSPPCPLFMTVVLGAMAVVVLLLLPSNTVSTKLNY